MKKVFSIFRKLLPGKTSRRTPESPRLRPAPPVATPSGCYSLESSPELERASAGLTIDLPLSSVACLLPDHLRARLAVAQLDSEIVSIPLQRVLPQLPRGDVQITFGELRQAAPHLFSPEEDEDSAWVQLPYAELTESCDPALTNYYEQFQGSPEPAAPQSRQHIGNAARAPRSRPNLVAASRLAGGTITPNPSADHGSADNGADEAPSAFSSTGSLSERSSGPTVLPPTAPGLSAEPASQPEVLLVDLASLVEKWPEALRSEIEQLNLLQAQVALPKDLVSAGLKQGRVTFRWDALRSWVQPAVALAPSAHDETELELPLQVIAPLFLAGERESNKPRRKVQFDEEIPDVFGMTESAPAPVAAQPEASEPETEEELDPEPSPVASRRVKANGSATPEQLVSCAVALKGVAGALVTLPDGLLVASRFPDNRDPHKVAAFLPQIFTRLGQYTEQLEMGELATLEFLVGNVPWKAFRLQQVLFVVFGRQGEALPSTELGRLAAELGKH